MQLMYRKWRHIKLHPGMHQNVCLSGPNLLHTGPVQSRAVSALLCPPAAKVNSRLPWVPTLGWQGAQGPAPNSTRQGELSWLWGQLPPSCMAIRTSPNHCGLAGSCSQRWDSSPNPAEIGAQIGSGWQGTNCSWSRSACALQHISWCTVFLGPVFIGIHK